MLALKDKLKKLELKHISMLPKILVNEPAISASVLVALQYNCSENIWYVLLTKRSMKLNSFPGEVSFPGGKIESTDRNEEEAAIRETKEEIDLNSEEIETIVKLPPQILRNKLVHIVIGFLRDNFNLITSTNLIDKDEVEAVFLVPLSEFLSSENHQSKSVEFNYEDSNLKFSIPSFKISIPSVVLQNNKQVFNKSFNIDIYGFTAIVCVNVAILVFDRPPAFQTDDNVINAKSSNEVYRDMIGRLKMMANLFRKEFIDSNRSGKL